MEFSIRVNLIALILWTQLLIDNNAWTITTQKNARQDKRGCPSGWTEAGDGCYRVMTFDQPFDVTSQSLSTLVPTTSGRGWTHARLNCLAQSADLVAINSDKEAYMIDNIRRKAGVDDSHYYWIGLHDSLTEGTFRWVDASNVTFSRWKVGEPTSSVSQSTRGRAENYVVARGSEEWMDVENTWTRFTSCVEPHAYICERPLRSLPTIENEVSRRITRVLGLAGATGPKGEQGPRGDPGPSGSPGPPGPLGFNGVNGQPGQDGQKGDKGSPGQDGLPGQKGDRGPPGMIQIMDTLIGPDGAQGEQGSKGDPGPQGLPGRDGRKGDRGFTGRVGPIGPNGPKGQKGSTGRPGIQGPRGFTGQQGPSGQPGPAGRPGQKGSMGQQGPKGQSGQKGDQGVSGPIGRPGPTGVTGSRGLRGPMGIQGLTGGSGPKGEKGSRGEEGPVGPTGPKGSRGDPGLQGMPGFDGVPGIPGAMGPEGQPGPPGGPGRDGQNGIPGMPGMDGMPGSKGEQGPAGLRGQVGPPGPPGPVPSNAAVQGPSTMNKGSNTYGWKGKTIFVNATAFCRGRAAAAYYHPLHCWQFITCGALYGGDMEHTCYAGRRFDHTGPECKKDHTCVFGAPSAANERWKEKKRLKALALKESSFSQQWAVVQRIRAAHSAYSAGLVVIFVLLAALAAIVTKLQLSHRKGHYRGTLGHSSSVPPLVIDRPASVI